MNKDGEFIGENVINFPHNCILNYRYLTEDGLNKISESGKIIDIKQIIKKALDVSKMNILYCFVIFLNVYFIY